MHYLVEKQKVLDMCCLGRLGRNKSQISPRLLYYLQRNRMVYKMHMKQQRNERLILFLASLASIGLLIENGVMGWEIWVPPVIIAGITSLWTIYLSQKPEYGIRIIFYFYYTVLLLFYHGIHRTSLYDIVVVVSFAIVSFAVFDQVFMMNVLLIEYLFLMAWHILNIPGWEKIEYDKLTVSRLLLHLGILVFNYYINVGAINGRLEAAESDMRKDAEIESYDADMEDFLSNISHEFRTPINVVNGMSDLLIKRSAGYEADSIKNAGIRLAYQIEDIQDYTECKRNKVILEEEDYMSTSLINDVVTSFRLLDHDELELVVDLDPRVPSKMNGDIKKLHKLYRHLLENAVKFTRQGGIYVKMHTENTDNGVNLCIEMTDTGIGMTRKAVESVAKGMFQVNKKRNRSSGGIGLGLFIVYGFVHKMGGAVKLESEKGVGTTVRLTIPQKVSDASPCLTLSETFTGAILFHVKSDKYKVPQLRDFYRAMAGNLASGTRVPLYSAETVRDVERMQDKVDVRFIFMGQEEYEENSGYFDSLCQKGIVVVVSANAGFKPSNGSKVMVMPKPLYGYPGDLGGNEAADKPDFTGVKALIVDDEPMNLIVASGIFRDYGMIIDTAGSGREAISRFRDNDYDVVFMDHMMPEMDGVEAMKQIRGVAKDMEKNVVIVALTANVVSGAREMFIKEGFNGFIAKPISTADFERVMLRELPVSKLHKGGDRA